MGWRAKVMAAGGTAAHFFRPELVQQDIDDLLEMVRGEEKEDSASKTIRPFSADDVPGAGSGATVRIAGVSGLDQINGFPSGRAFDLVPEGMTVLFGNNGAGKSGYARPAENAPPLGIQQPSQLHPKWSADDSGHSKMWWLSFIQEGAHCWGPSTLLCEADA